VSINRAGFVSWAEDKLLGPITDEPPIDPQVLIYHIIVGSADAAMSVFKPQGYYGEESTFIVCGPRDKAAGHKDGELWQLQSCKRQADAQFAGNAYANSVETSGFPNEPFSSAMLESLIKLTVQWCEEYKKPCKMVPRTGSIEEGGLGWHEWRKDWNLTGHVCPGAVREGQIRQIVIPKARARLEKRAEPKTPKPKKHPGNTPDGHVDVDGIFGIETIGALQYALNEHLEGADLHVDGIFGPATRLALKRYLKHKVDHKINTTDPDIGERAVRALQKRVAAKVDGRWDHKCTKDLQRYLNDGKF
jgi:hypothetical protein